MIGLSVGLCIAAIIRAEVNEADIEKIIGSTSASTPEAWEKIIDGYRASRWSHDPDKGEEVCRRFLAEGRIEQPRLTKGVVPDSRKEIWAHSADEVVYLPWE